MNGGTMVKGPALKMNTCMAGELMH